MSLDAKWQLFQQRFPTYIELLPCKRTLDNITSSGLSSNVLFYSHGFPLELICNYLINQMFGTLTIRSLIWDKELMYSESDHHFEIDLAHPAQSKCLKKYTEFIKQIASHKSLSGTSHIMIIHNIDALSTFTQSACQSFRVLFERYSSNIVFICTTTAFSKLDPPLTSRFINIRIPCFSESNIETILIDLDMTVPPNSSVPPPEKRNLAYCMYISSAHSLSASRTGLYYPMIDSTKHTPEQLRALTSKLQAYDASMSRITSDLVTLTNDDSKKASIVALGAYMDRLVSLTDGNRKCLYIEYLLNAANGV